MILLQSGFVAGEIIAVSVVNDPHEVDPHKIDSCEGSSHKVTPGDLDACDADSRIARAAQGDALAFEQLFAPHEPALRGFLARRIHPRLRRRFDESDVIQETRLDAFLRMPNFVNRQPMSFGKWLRRAAYQRFLDLYRKHDRAAQRSVRRELDKSDADHVLAQSIAERLLTPSRVMIAHEQHSVLRHAITQLSDPDREVLHLRYIKKLTNGQVAKELRIDERAASKRHGFALVRLAKLLHQLDDSRYRG